MSIVDIETTKDGNSHHMIQELETSNSEMKQRCNFFDTLKYSTLSDIALIILGSISSILHSVSHVLFFFFIGSLTDVFLNRTIHQNSEQNQTTNIKLPLSDQSSFSLNITENLKNSRKYGPDFFSAESEFQEEINKYVIGYIILGGIAFISSFPQIFCWEYSSERRLKRLQKIYFSQIIRQDISWFDTNDGGNLANKLSDDMEKIRDGTGYKNSMLLMFFTIAAVYIPMCLCINVKLTLVSLVFLLIPLGLMLYCGKLIAVSAVQEQAQYAVAGAIAEETLTNIKTVTAFGGQLYEKTRYHQVLENGRRIAMTKYNKLAVYVTAATAILLVFPIVPLWWWSEFLQAESISGGNVIAIILCTGGIGINIVLAIPYLDPIMASLGIFSSIIKIMDRTVVIDSHSKKGRMLSQLSGSIEFKNVHFSYPSRKEATILENLNLKIDSGKTVAIVGSSGAGKSTIINLILRFYDVSQGQVLIDGVPITEYNVEWLRRQIGLVSQEPVLFGVSIAENISYGRPNVTMKEIEEAAKRAHAHDFIIKFSEGYNTLVGELGSQLSGGQKQRIAIARALIRDPKILLLDEATSALDSMSEGLVQSALNKVMQGRTTVIVAHRLSTIRNADVIHVMKEGKIFESGSHEELMEKRSLYYSLVRTHQSVNIMKNVATTGSDFEFTRNNRLNSQNADNLKPKSYLRDNDVLNQDEEVEKALLPAGGDEDISNENENESSLNHKTSSIKKPMVQKESSNLLSSFRKPERPWLLLSYIGIFGGGILIPLIYYLQGNLISVVSSVGPDLLMKTRIWVAVYVAYSAISGVFQYMNLKGTCEASKRFILRIRMLVFENILRQPVGWFDNEESAPGILVTRLAQSAALIDAATGMQAGQVLFSAGVIICGFCISVLCDWKLGLVVFLGIPVILCIMFTQQTTKKKRQIQVAMKIEEAGKVASEFIQNIRTVKALGQEALFTGIYLRKLELPYKEAKREALSTAFLYAATQFVQYGMMAIGIKFGAVLFERDEIESNDIFKICFSLAVSVIILNDAAAHFNNLLKASIAVKMMNILLSRRSEIDATSPKGLKPEVNGNIEFRDVHFSYPTRPNIKVLDGLSLTVEAGKTVALVGESGCGKSTIISLLERFYNPDLGMIRVDGHDIRSMNVFHLRSGIGLITQEPSLFNLTIKDNITYGISTLDKIPFDDIQNAARIANAHDFIMTLPDRYDTIVGQRGVQLSGGQKQRIAIARALLRNPTILLMDEATSALDAENEKIVQAALDNAKQGRTCLVVAHRLSTIQDADKICVISDGIVVESGTDEELKKLNGHYCNLIKRQT